MAGAGHACGAIMADTPEHAIHPDTEINPALSRFPANLGGSVLKDLF